MKAIIVFRRASSTYEGTRIVEEQNLQREIKNLEKNNIEIVCILHVSFALQVRNLEFPKKGVES
jgi:hypothetical protein